VYLGPEASEREIVVAAHRSGLEVERPEDPDAALLEDLLAGRPVARYVGRMEFGPRALGHRSILAPAGDVALADRLNGVLRRDDFMPFAPILRAEEADAAFEGAQAAAPALRFMTVALPARAAWRAEAAAAVHVDGTARPQVVHGDEDAGLHRLLTAYRERTGRGTLINTSFNLHEEPIVQSPGDAVSAMRRARLPAMRLGPLLVRDRGARRTWDPR
jgi:carbamoyltransferase